MSAGTALRELVARAPAEKVDEVIGDIGERNRVRVIKFEAIRGEAGVRRRKVFDEEFVPRWTRQAILNMDEMRMALGLKPRYWAALAQSMGGTLVDISMNTRMNPGGIDYCADSLGNNSSRPAVARYIALTENGTAVSASDTALASEITTNGLQRVVGTYAHTSGVASYTLANTFTASGTFSTVQKAGMFNASSGPTMAFENTFTSTALASSDQLSVTWTVNV